MPDQTSLQNDARRIGDIIRRIETAADPNVRAMASELVEAVMALHGSALERILTIASECGEAGEEIIRRCGRDELVSSILVLYDLHPENMEARVRRALEKAQPSLAANGARADLVSIGADGSVKLRLDWTSHMCGASGVRSSLQAAMEGAAPDAAAVYIEEAAPASFVPLGKLLEQPQVAAPEGRYLETRNSKLESLGEKNLSPRTPEGRGAGEEGIARYVH